MGDADIMDIILENDPLMPNLHLKQKVNHGMDTMATPAITVTDITTDVKTHNGLISTQEPKCFSLSHWHKNWKHILSKSTFFFLKISKFYDSNQNIFFYQSNKVNLLCKTQSFPIRLNN